MDFQNSCLQQTKSVISRIGRCCLLASSCSRVELFTVVYERPRVLNILQYFIFFFFFFFFFVPFTMLSQHKVSEKRKCTNLSIGAKLELHKKLESGVSKARVCEEYGV